MLANLAQDTLVLYVGYAITAVYTAESRMLEVWQSIKVKDDSECYQPIKDLLKGVKNVRVKDEVVKTTEFWGGITRHRSYRLTEEGYPDASASALVGSTEKVTA